MTLFISLLQICIEVVWWIIVVQFVLSVLIMFNVVSLVNEYVRTIWDLLYTITEPVYRPIRRILPDFGPLDLSPMVVILFLILLERVVIPALAHMAVGPTY